MSSPKFAEVNLGDVLPSKQYQINRDSLVRYAGASGDFNPIHYNDEFAKSVGLDGVIAHGMLTMAKAINIVTDYLDGESWRIREYGVRFTRPVPVPALESIAIDVNAKIAALDSETRIARIDLDVRFEGQAVLGRARALVELA